MGVISLVQSLQVTSITAGLELILCNISRNVQDNSQIITQVEGNSFKAEIEDTRPKRTRRLNCIGDN